MTQSRPQPNALHVLYIERRTARPPTAAFRRAFGPTPHGLGKCASTLDRIDLGSRLHLLTRQPDPGRGLFGRRRKPMPLMTPAELEAIRDWAEGRLAQVQ